MKPYFNHEQLIILKQYVGVKITSHPNPCLQCLTHMIQGAFRGLDSLEKLFLEYNRLTTLASRVLADLPRPFTLGLRSGDSSRENPWSCDDGSVPHTLLDSTNPANVSLNARH